LLRVFWKRIIFDEGHFVSDRNTDRVIFADQLRSESRWVCTGTPVRTITLMDDIERLRQIVTFLKLDPYRCNASWLALFGQSASASLQDRLMTLLNRICVRHRTEDLDREIPLPECSVTRVFLDMAPHERVRYNVRVASIKANLLLSEEEGVDWFLHPNNRKHATMVVGHLQETCFHLIPLVNDTETNVAEWMEKKQRNPESRSQALEIIQHANRDGVNVLQGGLIPPSDAPGFLLRGVPVFLRTLERVPPYLSHVIPHQVPLGDSGFHVASLRDFDLLEELKGALLRRPFSVPEAAVKRKTLEEELTKTPEKRKMKAARWLRDDFDLVLADQSGEDRAKDQEALKGLVLDGTTSTKLNYLMRRLGEHPNEKTIVFTQHFNNLARIHEALGITGIRYVSFSLHQVDPPSPQPFFAWLSALSDLLIDTKAKVADDHHIQHVQADSRHHHANRPGCLRN